MRKHRLTLRTASSYFPSFSPTRSLNICLFSKIAIVAPLLFICGVANVSAQTKPGIMRPNEVIEIPAGSQGSQNHQVGIDSQQTVRIDVSAMSGPYGLAVFPSGGTAVAGDGAANASGYNYPSIVLAISATPLRTPIGTDSDKDYADNPQTIPGVAGGDNNITWLDVTSKLIAIDKDGNELVTCGTDPCIQIIGILPGTTTAALKPQVAATVADDLAKVASATAGLYPGVGTIVTTAAGGVQVAFDNLFPPKNTAYQYPYLDTSDPQHPAFGWFFQKNDGATPPVSILGMQIGEVMLQTSTLVKRIEIDTRALSQWSKAPDTSNKHDKYLYTPVKNYVEVPGNGPDFAHLMDLSQFPLVIAKADVKKILNINDDKEDDKEYEALFAGKTPALTGTSPSHAFVTKASLSTYLGLSK